jgi:hypothetical protein
MIGSLEVREEGMSIWKAMSRDAAGSHLKLTAQAHTPSLLSIECDADIQSAAASYPRWARAIRVIPTSNALQLGEEKHWRAFMQCHDDSTAHEPAEEWMELHP